jgi:hypothetical protein
VKNQADTLGGAKKNSMIHKGGIYRMTFENTFLEAQEFITKFVLNFHLSSQGRLASIIKQSLRGHHLSKT